MIGEVMKVLMMVLAAFFLISCGGEKGRSSDDGETNQVDETNENVENSDNLSDTPASSSSTECSGDVNITSGSYSFSSSSSSLERAIRKLRRACAQETGLSCRSINMSQFSGLGEDNEYSGQRGSLTWSCS